jgi:hypothetical protein
LIAAQKFVPADASFGLNGANLVLQIAQKVLAARIAERTELSCLLCP